MIVIIVNQLINMISDIELSYIAGWCDGEASFGLNKQKRKSMKCGFDYTPKITLTNTDKEIIEYLKKTLSLNSQIGSYNKIGTPIFQIQIFRMNEVIRVCTLLEPFLRTKKEECKLLKEWCIHHLERKKEVGWNHSPDIILYDDIDHKIFKELRILKTKGINRIGGV